MAIPQSVQIVLDAVFALKERKGSLKSHVYNYIAEINNCEVNRPVLRKAFAEGVNRGLLKVVGGKYNLTLKKYINEARHRNRRRRYSGRRRRRHSRRHSGRRRRRHGVDEEIHSRRPSRRREVDIEDNIKTARRRRRTTKSRTSRRGRRRQEAESDGQKPDKGEISGQEQNASNPTSENQPNQA